MYKEGGCSRRNFALILIVTFGNYFFIGSSDFLEQACITRSLFARLYYEGEKGT